DVRPFRGRPETVFSCIGQDIKGNSAGSLPMSGMALIPAIIYIVRGGALIISRPVRVIALGHVIVSTGAVAGGWVSHSSPSVHVNLHVECCAGHTTIV